MTQPTTTATSAPASRKPPSTPTALSDAVVQRVHFVNAVHIIGSGKAPTNSLDADVHGCDLDLTPAGIIVTWGKGRALVPFTNIRAVELV